MSSRTVALALVAMVLLSGCSMFGSGGSEAPETTVGEPPDHHELVFGSNTNDHPFEATVTVSKNGTMLREQTVASDGSGMYRNLTAVDEPGPYTVTVNTTIPGVGGGNMSERFTVEGAPGNATMIRVAYQGIYHQTFGLPRRPLPHTVGVRSDAIHYGGERGTELDVRVWYRGERIAAETMRAYDDDQFQEVVDLEKTGVYQVSARGTDGEWFNRTVTVTDPKQVIKVGVDHDGSVGRIRVLRVELV